MALLSKSQQAMGPSEADWNHHKEHIKLLYCIEDRELKGPHGVQEEMKRRYQFDADKYQYEKHFKQWSFRKNLKKAEWIPISQKISARKRAGKDSEVSCEGVPIPAKRVKRALRRYQNTASEPSLFDRDRVNSPQTPEGITIATPKAIEDNFDIYQRLPISQYFSALLHQVTIPQGLSTVYPTSGPKASVNISVPFSSTPQVVPLSTCMLGIRLDHCSVPNSGAWIPDLGTAFCEAPLQGHELFHQLPNFTETLGTLHSMIYFVSNGYLATAAYNIRQSMIKWLQQEDNGPLLRRLLSVGGPTAASMLRELYPLAIEAQEASIITIFLELGCSPNFIWSNNRSPRIYRGVTALGLACEERNLELVRVLLTSGANPNMSSKVSSWQIQYKCYTTEAQCPMVLSIWGHACIYGIMAEERTEDESILSFIQLLIENGALVRDTNPMDHVPLVEAVRFGHQNVARLLLDQGADVNFSDKKGNLPLTTAIKKHNSSCPKEMDSSLSMIEFLLGEGADINSGDGDGNLPLKIAIENCEFGSPAEINQSLSIVQLLVKAGADVNAHCIRGLWWSGWKDILPLDMAARKGSLKLVELLYLAGARPSSLALVCAVKGGNEQVVKFMLKVFLTEPNIPAQQSALSDAVRSKNVELFRLIFQSTARHGRFYLTSAVTTAIDVGLCDIVPELLSAGLHYPEFPKSLQPALKSAVSSGNANIVDHLLSIGVEASQDILEQALNSKHEPMIEKVFDLGETLWPLDETEERVYKSDESDKSDDSDESDEDLNRHRKICPACWKKAHREASSPLLAAVHFGNRDIVKRVMEREKPLNNTNALVLAIDSENFDVAITLLEAGSPVNASACNTYQNTTPLQAAVERNNLPLVQALLEYGANPELSSISGSWDHEPRIAKSPLQMTVTKGYCGIAEMLLQAGANVNDPQAKALGQSALTLAIGYNQQEMLDLVVREGADVMDSIALYTAVQENNVPLVDSLLNSVLTLGQGCSGGFGARALCEAVRHKSMDLVRLLLSAGVDPNKHPHEKTAYQFTDLEQKTVLGVAITHPDRPVIGIIEILLQAGADPNSIIDLHGYEAGRRTALVAAVATGDVSLVTLLIQHGANPNENPKGATWRTPLQAACEAGKLSVVQLLLDYNVDVNAPPTWYNGGTALQLAAISGNVRIVHALLDHGADINAPAGRVRGRSALEGAAENGRLDTIIVLLNAGVGIHGSYEGQYNRALKFAGKQGYHHIQQLLRVRFEATA